MGAELAREGGREIAKSFAGKLGSHSISIKPSSHGNTHRGKVAAQPSAASIASTSFPAT